MIRGWFTLIVAILAVMGCSGIQVGQDYDPATPMDTLGNFRWSTDAQAKTGDPRIDNPLRDTRIRTAVERVLTEKGFTRSTGDAPTFVIRYQYVLRQRVESSGTSSGIGFGIGRYGRHGGIAIGTGDTIRQYDEGMLVVDFLVPDSDQLLWRGTGTQRFRQYDDPTKTSRDINRLVEAVLKQFPPDK